MAVAIFKSPADRARRTVAKFPFFDQTNRLKLVDASRQIRQEIRQSIANQLIIARRYFTGFFQKYSMQIIDI